MIEIILSIDNELYRIDGADEENPDIVWIERINGLGGALEEYHELERKKFNAAIQEALELSNIVEITEPINITLLD